MRRRTRRVFGRAYHRTAGPVRRMGDDQSGCTSPPLSRRNVLRTACATRPYVYPGCDWYARDRLSRPGVRQWAMPPRRPRLRSAVTAREPRRRSIRPAAAGRAAPPATVCPRPLPWPWAREPRSRRARGRRRPASCLSTGRVRSAAALFRARNSDSALRRDVLASARRNCARRPARVPARLGPRRSTCPASRRSCRRPRSGTSCRASGAVSVAHAGPGRGSTC